MTLRPDMQSTDTAAAADDQQARLLTIPDQILWENKYEAVLDVANRERNKALDDKEAERFARATDAILTDLRQLRKCGYSRDEAAHKLIYERRGWNPAYDNLDALKIVNALGYDYRVQPKEGPIFSAPPSQRRHGGGA